MTNAAQFDLAFGTDEISVIRGNFMQPGVDLLINGEVYTVSHARCEICETWGPCAEHIGLARQAIRLHMAELPLPFDAESESVYRRWQLVHDNLSVAGDD